MTEGATNIWLVLIGALTLGGSALAFTILVAFRTGTILERIGNLEKSGLGYHRRFDELKENDKGQNAALDGIRETLGTMRLELELKGYLRERTKG